MVLVLEEMSSTSCLRHGGWAPTLVSMLLGAVPRSLTLAGEGGTTLRLGNLELGKNA